jgi:hypothetical protein
VRDWIRAEARVLIMALGFGVVVAILAFGATSLRSPAVLPDFDYSLNGTGSGSYHLTPHSYDVNLSGFDWLTGSPHGWSYTDNTLARAGLEPPRVVYGPIPSDIQGRMAVPIPVGFAIGTLFWLAVVILARRRTSRDTPER